MLAFERIELGAVLAFQRRLAFGGQKAIAHAVQQDRVDLEPKPKRRRQQFNFVIQRRVEERRIIRVDRDWDTSLIQPPQRMRRVVGIHLQTQVARRADLQRDLLIG